MRITNVTRISALRRRLADFDYVCSGTLLRRSLICGKDNCRCKADPPALHGPYYYWSRRHSGRLLQKVLSLSQAKFVERAIRNYRKALQLLRQWEAETARVVDRQKFSKKPNS
ncbi:MAG: hypothetical protein HY221_02065 [Candidatus Sungbacteria bacterium]|uniref:DUF6788 domain-containing protein n=1 Tax=Candidatus Sungiibacteriota bacterium TaxID=2750080 RepID=A0A932R0A1_9BACT|nr:hypothetical protein [Candidatus Sungbacteria bacterium]